MMPAEAQTNLSKRVLLRRFGAISEGVILELSPSDDYIKIRWPSAAETWYPLDEYEFVESLPGPMQVAVKGVDPLDWDEIEAMFQKWQFSPTRSDGPDSAIVLPVKKEEEYGI